MKELIHFIDLDDNEKEIQALARTIGEGLCDIARQIGEKAAACTLTRIQKTDLDELLSASTVPLSATEIAFKSGLLGNVLVLMRTQELHHLGELVSGIEAQPDKVLPAEILEGCLQFLAKAMDISNQRFAEAHGKTVASGMPELINPDGNPASLLPLQNAYRGILCITYQLLLEPTLDFRVQVLVQPDLLGSLIALVRGSESGRMPENVYSERPVAPREKTQMSDLSSGAEKQDPARTASQPGPQSNWNIDLLLDVELPIVVSFGETAMQLKDVLKLGVGSVIELDKTVNDPVTLIVNQKPIARGEVVMVESNYGVRILEVESTAERIRSLG